MNLHLFKTQLKDHLSGCGICNRYRPERCKEPLKPHGVPNLPWEKVGVDLFVLDGQSFLIAVDYSSGYFEVQDMSSTTSTWVITGLVFQASYSCDRHQWQTV